MKKIKPMIIAMMAMLPLSLGGCVKETISYVNISTSGSEYISNFGTTSIAFTIGDHYKDKVQWNTSLFKRNAEVSAEEIFKTPSQLMGKNVRFVSLDGTNTVLRLEFSGKCDSQYVEVEKSLMLDFNTSKVFQGITVEAADAETSFMRAGFVYSSRLNSGCDSLTLTGETRGITTSKYAAERTLFFKDIGERGLIEGFKKSDDSTGSITIKTSNDGIVELALKDLQYENEGTYEKPLQCKINLYYEAYKGLFNIAADDNLQLELKFWASTTGEVGDTYIAPGCDEPLSKTFYFSERPVTK